MFKDCYLVETTLSSSKIFNGFSKKTHDMKVSKGIYGYEILDTNESLYQLISKFIEGLDDNNNKNGSDQIKIDQIK
jgi:hypothetical protein